jgi:hypothetical protein
MGYGCGVKRTQDLFAQRRRVHGQHARLGSQVGRGGPDSSSNRLCNVHAADVWGFRGWRRVVSESSLLQGLGDGFQDFFVVAGIANDLFNGSLGCLGFEVVAKGFADFFVFLVTKGVEDASGHFFPIE